MYRVCVDEIVQLLESWKAALEDEKKRVRIFLQLPEGIKKRAINVARYLENEGFEVVVDVEPCFGSCDLPFHRAKIEGCDVILHLGHAPLVETSGWVKKEGLGVLFYPVKTEVSRDEFSYLIDKCVTILKDKGARAVSIGATVQNVEIAERLRTELEKRNINVFTARSSRTALEGVVLGCDYSALRLVEKRIDVHILIVGGAFHLRGAILDLKKPILHVNVEERTVRFVELDERERLTKQRLMLVEKFKEAKCIGVVTSTKPGQRFADPWKVKEALQKMGKDIVIISGDNISREKLEGLKVDFFVNLACPRLEEDKNRFPNPVISWSTLLKYLKVIDID